MLTQKQKEESVKTHGSFSDGAKNYYLTNYPEYTRDYTLAEERYHFKAAAVDDDGVDYDIFWKITNPTAEEECDMCNWDDFYVIKSSVQYN